MALQAPNELGTNSDNASNQMANAWLNNRMMIDFPAGTALDAVGKCRAHCRVGQIIKEAVLSKRSNAYRENGHTKKRK